MQEDHGSDREPHRRTRGRLWVLLAAIACLATTGCGVALYGPVLLLLLLGSSSKNQIRTTFPDVAISSLEAPTLASVTVGTTTVTDANGNKGPGIASVDFPEIFGTSQSDRMAGQTTAASDQLLIQINGDAPQTITLGVATIGTEVAALIQTAVRALKPSGSSTTISADAYGLFTCSFDPVIQQYLLRSGVPGHTSAVVVNPKLASGSISTNAAATAKNLRLGLANNGRERSGAENLSYVIFNHGTDVMPAGMPVNVWISKNKALDKTNAVLIRQDQTTNQVEVAVARRFTSKNQAPPKPVLASSLPPGQYYAIFEANPGGSSGGEQSQNLLDNLRTFSRPIEISSTAVVSTQTGTQTQQQQQQTGTTPPIELTPTDFVCSIAGIASGTIQCSVQVQNFNGAITAPVPLAIDIALNPNGTFVAPALISDPAGQLAGVFVNSIDFRQTVQLVLDSGGPTGIPLAVSVSGNTVTATWDGASDVTPVVSLTDAVQASALASAILDVPFDGIGSPQTQSLTQVVKAAGFTSGATVTTGGRGIAHQIVSFDVSPSQQTTQQFAFDATLPAAFPSGQLPQKFFAFARVTPEANPQKIAIAPNAVRTARNYLRIVSQQTATFDNGTFLPTGSASDFLPFAAVIGRPTNSGLVQGHQTIFRFTIPTTGISLDESQLLMIVQSTEFDPHLSLLDSTGHLIASSDDSALGLEPLIYVPALATNNNPNFYAIVSNASFTDQTQAAGAAFSLIISVNSRQQGDPSLVAAVDQEDLLAASNTAVALNPTLGQVENDKLIEFSLAQEKSEIMFVLPALARVKFKSSPIFAVGVNTTITQFVEGKPVTQVAFQAEVDPATLQVVYRPSGGTIDTSHLLSPGIYTFDFASLGGPDPTNYILEVDTDYVPAGTQ